MENQKCVKCGARVSLAWVSHMKNQPSLPRSKEVLESNMKSLLAELANCPNGLSCINSLREANKGGEL